MHILYICFLLSLGYVQIFAKQDDWHAARCPFVIAVIKHLAKLLKSGGCDGAAVWGKKQIPVPCCRQAHFQGCVWAVMACTELQPQSFPAAGIAICMLQSKIWEMCKDHTGQAGAIIPIFNASPMPSQSMAALTSKLQILHQAREISRLDPHLSSGGDSQFLDSDTALPSLTHCKFKGANLHQFRLQIEGNKTSSKRKTQGSRLDPTQGVAQTAASHPNAHACESGNESKPCGSDTSLFIAAVFT